MSRYCAGTRARSSARSTRATTAGEIFPTGQGLYELIRSQSAHYGSLIRTPYGEPFFCPETLEVQDVLQLGVQSM